MGESRGGEGGGRRPTTDQGQAAQPPVVSIVGTFQAATNLFVIEVEDAERTRKIVHLEFDADGTPGVVDTTPETRFSTPYGGSSEPTGGNDQ